MTDNNKLKIGLYYYKIRNFGDLLNELILNRLFSDDVAYERADFPNADMIALGSILDRLVENSLIGEGDREQQRCANQNRMIHVWGTGLITQYDDQNHNIVRPMAIHALRGELTRQQISYFSGQKIECLLADPGLLAPLAVPPSEKKWRLGIVPHYVDEENPVFDRLRMQVSDSILINVRDEPEIVLKQISQCERILSTSLHGLIVADAYQIPNCWCVASDRIWGSGYKYRDYFSSFHTEREPFVFGENGSFPHLERDYKLSYYDYDEVRAKQNGLIECFPFSKSGIKTYETRNTSIVFMKKEGRILNSAEKTSAVVSLGVQDLIWNYNHAPAQSQWDVLLKIRESVIEIIQGDIRNEKGTFDAVTWETINMISEAPFHFFQKTCKTYASRPTGINLPRASIIKQNSVDTPIVSVIISAYNCEDYIERSLVSLQNQTLRNFEAICIDDGSTDSTLEILQAFSERDSRFTVFHEENLGQASGRNAGIAAAKGQYIQFLDGDDQLTEDALQTLVGIADQNDLDILYYDGKTVYDDDELREKYPWSADAYEYRREISEIISGVEYLCFSVEDGKFRASSCMAVYKRAFIQSVNLTFVDGILHEDNLFTITALMNAKRVWHTQEQYYIRFFHRGSTMTGKKTFLHFYGYLYTCLRLNDLVCCIPFSERFDKCLSDLIEMMRLCCKMTYEDLDNQEECRPKLSSVEKLFLERFILMPERIIETEYVADEGALNELRNSKSYRLGRLLTYPVRKCRELILLRKQTTAYTPR